MKKLLLLIFLVAFTNSYSSEIWISTGTMSQDNSDWVRSLASNQEGSLFASSWGVGIYKLGANNSPWIFSGLSGKKVSDIFTAPNGFIYAYFNDENGSYIYRSVDNGLTWQEVFTRGFANYYGSGGEMIFLEDGSIVATIHVKTEPTFGHGATYIFKSVNSGNDWTHINTLYGGEGGGMQLLNDGNIIAGTPSGVIQSIDKGASWLGITSFPFVYVQNILQDTDNFLYVCDAHFPNLSIDNGKNFTAVITPVSDKYTIEASFVASNGDFYISYDNGCVYRSVNKCNTWEVLTAGFPVSTKVCSFTEAKGKIYAGTNNKGIFYLSSSVSGIQNGNGIVKDFSLKQNYPNPFNPATKISFSIPKSSFVNLSVFDITGKALAVLVSEYKSSGSYEINFDASNLSGGIYFYKLQADGFSETKRMILTK